MASEVFLPEEGTLVTGNSQINIRLDAWATPLGETETGVIRVYNSVQLHNKDNWVGSYSNPNAKVQSEIRKNSSSTATTVQWDASSLNLTSWTTVSRSYLDLTMTKDGQVSYQVSAQSINGDNGVPTFGQFNLSWYDVTLTGLGKAKHTVAFNLGYSGAPTLNSEPKICGTPFNMPSDPTRTNYKFIGWKSNISGGDPNIYKQANSTSGNHDGGYTHDQFGGTVTLTAQWELVGPSVILDANIYYNEDYARTNQSGNRVYTSNNYLFSSSGAKASWTKFTSNTAYSSYPNEYQTEPRVYIPNSNKLDFSMRGTPYTHAGEFDVEFCGYYTGKTWKEPGIQVYMPKFDWIYGTNRAWATVAVPNTDYFGPLETLDNTEWNKNDFYYPEYEYNYQKTDDSDNPLEQVNGQGLYVPKIGSKVDSSSISLPAWQMSGSATYTFYALWTKKDLTFTYDPNGGTAPEHDENIQQIGKPGPVTETGSVQEFNILTFEDTEIKPPVGYKFKEWNTSADGTGNKIEEGRSLILGGYLNDVTLYAQYEQYPRTTVVLHANTKEATDNGPACFIHLPDNDNKTRRGYYDAGAGDIQINYRGQPYLKNSKFLGYEDENGQLVYAVDKRLRVEYTKNNVTYVLNPARAIYNPKYFDGNVTFDDDTIPHLSDSRPYSWVEGKKPDVFTGYQWAYPATEGEVIHLYARWGGATNASIYDNGEWKSAYIYINKNVSNPSLEPDWEQIDAADFLI